VGVLLGKKGITFHTYKDQVIFERNEVLKDDGTPYTVFTPYSRKWRATLSESSFKPFETKKYFSSFIRQPLLPIPSLDSMGFKETHTDFPPDHWKKDVILSYSDKRDFPGVQGTTRLGVHLRFGTISIRELAKSAGGINATYLNELIWRDFYHMILWHFPRVGKGKAFKPEYERIKWRNNEKEFQCWCDGLTGYPIVDAGMRELNETGYMHNRVRMIVASFLTKHLLIDWRWGEAYFASKLLDFDLAANNGGWQWAAGSGCDAAPYFRVFNPYLQTKKFDPQFTYIRKWVPEFEGFDYPKPVVEHEFARKRCLEVYGAALKKN
jgi:deoxyribodipyrimidine photo-lyase